MLPGPQKLAQRLHGQAEHGQVTVEPCQRDHGSTRGRAPNDLSTLRTTPAAKGHLPAKRAHAKRSAALVPHAKDTASLRQVCLRATERCQRKAKLQNVPEKSATLFPNHL